MATLREQETPVSSTRLVDSDSQDRASSAYQRRFDLVFNSYFRFLDAWRTNNLIHSTATYRRLNALWWHAPTIEEGLYQDEYFEASAEILDRVISYNKRSGSITVGALAIVERNIGQIDGMLGKFRSGNYQGHGYALMEDLISHGTPSQRHLGIATLGTHLDTLEEIIKGGDVVGLAESAFITLAQLGDESDPEDTQVIQSARRVITTTTTSQSESNEVDELKFHFLTRSLLRRRFTFDSFVATEVIPAFLERYGFTEDYLVELQASTAGRSKADIVDIVRKNLTWIRNLEAAEPGICNYLSKEFGIHNFNRYMVDDLLNQYRNRDDTELPYGVVLFPRHDHNGAFEQASYRLYKLAQQLEGRYHIRIVEAADKIDIARALYRLDAKYGNHHKISFAIIGGHGTENSITFGGSERSHYLLTTDLFDPRFYGIRRYLVDHPTLVLVSCSTGTKEGIGQQLSRTLNATVIAPDRPTGLESIVPKFDDQGLDFDVIYGASEATTVYNAK